jgi:hypothetical protein
MIELPFNRSTNRRLAWGWVCEPLGSSRNVQGSPVMNRVVWLPALILLAIVATGCQSTKFPSPKWPDFAMFKKKDKDLAPPSEHFNVDEQTQLAGNPASERKPTDIPGEAPAGVVKAPADLAKPTAPMVAGKSGSSSTTGTATKPGNAPSATQPIRKPYEMARSSAEGVKQAAGSLASDIEKNSQAAAEQVNRNANEVVGQFQQQGRDLANAANNSLNQAANDLNQKANNALNAIAPASQSGNPASSGGDFAFSRPTGSAPSSSAPSGSTSPPWSSPATPQGSAQATPAKTITPINPAPAQVDPLKSLAAGAALTPSTPSSANPAPSGFNPNPVASAERQLQPINQQMVNQNLGAPATNPASNNSASTAASPQFQLPVAQPPAFLANRSSTPAAGASTAPFNSPPPASSPQFSPQPTAPMASAQPARQPLGGNPPTNPAPQAGGNKYPSTGFNSFVASGSNPSAAPAAPLGNSAFNAPAATNPNLSAQSPNANAAWRNQASPIAASSSGSEAAATRPVSHNAELPAELMQRSGGYAPGSISGSSSGETLWR